MVKAMHTILIETGMPVELLWLIKLCLSETCSKVRTCRHLSLSLLRMGLKQRAALS